MTKYQSLLKLFSTKKRPLINIILDGYGLGLYDHTNAIYRSSTPFIKYLWKHFPKTSLATHGPYVGLPSKKNIGGSEVGHLTIGAGKILQQGPTIINQMIANQSFFQQPVLNEIYETAKHHQLHLIGLLSDGNVHSHVDHFIAIIQEAARRGIKKCYVHALLDGRDVGVQTAQIYIKQLEDVFQEIHSSHPDFEYAFASGGGREVITMDRDQNWFKIEKGWQCHVLGQSKSNFESMQAALDYFRKITPNLIDQDIPAFNIYNQQHKIPTINDGDAVICMNFRGDRMIEISRAFTEKNFNEFPLQRPKILFAGMTVYDEDTQLPKKSIIHRPVVDNPFGKRILEAGLNQFRLAETQKYAHVTFFFNGGYRHPLDPIKEKYFLIESDKNISFNQAPQMKAFEIAKKAEELILSQDFDYGLINFANADMVGHTGDMQATILAVEVIDRVVQKICHMIQKVNGIAIITADHGNADEMLIYNKKTKKEEISTKHSCNLVPFIIFDPLFNNQYQLKPTTDDQVMDLSMIAATNFLLLGLMPPSDINDSLFKL